MNADVRGDQQVLRALNRSLVEKLFEEHRLLSRSEIARISGLAKPTVSSIVVDLVEEGVVREVGLGTSQQGAGRPALMLEYDSQRQSLVGIHIGINRIAVMIANAHGETVHRLERPSLRKGEGLAPVVAAVREALELARVPIERVTAAGVCVPGMMDLDTGVCLLAPNLGWTDVPVQAELERELGIPVYAMNTTQAMVAAEAEEGAAVGAADVVLLYAGTGVGAGILAGGRIFRGSGGLTGEIGHCQVPGNELLCSCGRLGCLETLVSGPAIARLAAEAIETGHLALPHGGGRGPIAPETVAGAAASGSEEAVRIFERVSDGLAFAASWLIDLFNPEVLVLAGGLMGAGAPLLEPLERKIIERTLPLHRRRLQIVTASMGRDASVRGAVLLARQRTGGHYRVVFGAH